ncbi:P-loop containing nucleoside triphosphate hydrolase protein [Syncephalis pseudoplumigaleata]|uniref:P-loop containing nucleoside triphosphate hydrolase protein n=1 Tax=Syncephalis pseudoplumigaleata TaxID=1712513 RepID=A0A4P9YZC9_9FUNG|nr:P-loop containing nucleoside triphosphate hydrolase protein [Syncephalis pseudoplumigaleata]|eukprot:RKP25507.1 P-loop containing nucleoside triphosphate hydrolase protein [Syncephalis pseudoplumigaleata]
MASVADSSLDYWAEHLSAIRLDDEQTDQARQAGGTPREKPLPGLERAYAGLLEMVIYPLRYPHYFTRLNIQPPKGILLYGPPGVGKTHLVTQVASLCRAALISIHGASDALTPHRHATGMGGQESRVVAQLLTLMDGMASSARWVVVAATNRPNAIDPALRRPGRFDRELSVDPPGERVRLEILRYLTSHLAMGADVSFDELARQTNGYVGADLAALCREAIAAAVLRKSQAADASLEVVRSDFVRALATVVPSLLRSTQVDVSMTTWDSIGGLEEAKKRLRQAVEWPMLYPDTFRRLGLKAPRGVLLYGPPGCSKTTLVKAVANTSGASFFTLSGAAVYSAYVGESERIVRDLFHRARQSRPAVIFLDEVDALVGKRELGGDGSGDPVRDRLLAALLNEMDGVETADSVLVVGATNRPDMLDAALLRPGRFDRQIYASSRVVIPPPDAPARRQILAVHTKHVPLAANVALDAIADQTHKYSGADLQNICREAALSALRRDHSTRQVTMQDFSDALRIVQPSLSDETLAWYSEYNARISRSSQPAS